mmetsp:Transcript_29676/g.63571  ORF Transcript_29676/g.63571 Transcript_29676/m.63571 type:complete len:306 (-) Transcript_29676:55-972(-)|eukprot:CAMPEP_0201127078 /NCGR_PEP_ID=MMETSP0850-20130426/28727_1 /ASSEMBLY_ACC=CAM_ASM_000622 /TAXON_ID=183588 /ORGANISM="Pseudo-nitzschia fraudulenta, Strain WWA7" /LENGTH=305 /DNA_ID=CAMNT_0047395777 /DNA_START=79 /DNA_END=996 /DNA_ORIENTATION=+
MASTSTIIPSNNETSQDSAESREHSESQQATIFDKTTEKGAENGLFRACMVSIRSAHVSANRLRAALVLSGLFTDKKVYREVIALFYVATTTMEKKMIALKEDEGDEICDELLSLGYRFGPQYEKDLKNLYDDGEDWKSDVEKVVEKSTNGAKAYIKSIEGMSTGAELAGAAFCLWGALIIGGGAAAMPRVESLCGKNACHLFESVTGPGRGERKAVFIKTWDSLAVREAEGDNDTIPEEKKDEHERPSSLFTKIVSVSKKCMHGNNELIMSVKRNPWWLKYVASSAVGLIAVGIYYFNQKSARK